MSELPDMTYEEAETLWQQTDHAIWAAGQSLSPIHAADAAAFFLEGYLHARDMLRSRCDTGIIGGGTPSVGMHLLAEERMDRPLATEELAFRATRMLKDAAKRADPYNDFGGVMGIQDELGEIFEQLEADLRQATRRARRLIGRIDKLEAGELNVELLRANTASVAERTVRSDDQADTHAANGEITCER